MERLLGPVLYAESQPDPNRWSFWLRLYLRGGDGNPPPLELTFFERSGQDWQPVQDLTISGPCKDADFSQLQDPRYAGIYWGWHVQLPRGKTARVLKYQISAARAGVAFEPIEVFEVVVPAQGHLPRAAFFSCSGAPNPSKLTGHDPLALWEAMLDEHQAMVYAPKPDGFSLLIGGGDQLYADSIFTSPSDFPLLWRFANRLSNKQRVLLQLGSTWEQERARVLAGYVRLYCLNWGEGSGISEMLARVPCALTWDDHDILDGWGSQELLQGCDVYRMIYPEAARTFEAFQLGREGCTGKSLPNPLLKNQPPPHYLQTLAFVGKDCELDLVLLDGRSGRTDTQVLSPEQTEALDAWRQQHVARSQGAPQRKRHVLVVTSVPLVYRRFSAEIELMASTAAVIREQGLRDDLLDLWESRLHRSERARLIKNLLTHSREAQCAVTILAGDVHVGAHGRITSREPEHLVGGKPMTVIEQLISSGIVHPPVGGLEMLGMDMISNTGADHSLGPLIETRLLPLDNGKRVLSERNWLDIEPERAARSELRLQWYAERTKRQPTKVVVTPPAL
jgi:hypothetical protein